jgi:hypothetical protein
LFLNRNNALLKRIDAWLRCCYPRLNFNNFNENPGWARSPVSVPLSVPTIRPQPDAPRRLRLGACR